MMLLIGKLLRNIVVTLFDVMWFMEISVVLNLFVLSWFVYVFE